LRICVTVYTQYRRVTDRQTDGQTDGRTDRRTDRQTDGQTSCHGIVHAMHTRRAVKKLTCIIYTAVCVGAKLQKAIKLDAFKFNLVTFSYAKY